MVVDEAQVKLYNKLIKSDAKRKYDNKIHLDAFSRSLSIF